MNIMLDDATRYRLLKLLQDDPRLSQRKLARAMGISLGKVNYCLNALLKKGLVKISDFKNNPNKNQYAYLLTKRGVEEKARVTLEFLKQKQREYELLRTELEQLRAEVSMMDAQAPGRAQD